MPVDPNAEFNPVIVCGLSNIGNTCYFNSGLQALVNTSEFVTALRFCGNSTTREKERHQLLRRSNVARRTLISQCNTVVDQMDYGEEPKVAPVGLLKGLQALHEQFEGFSQQDCPEMMHALLQSVDDETHLTMETKVILQSDLRPPKSVNSLHEYDALKFMHAVNQENERREIETQRAKGKSASEVFFRAPHLTRSAVNDPFMGYTLSEVTCNACKQVSRVIDSFTSLTVEIPSTKQRKLYADDHPRAPKQEQPRSYNPFTALCRCIAAVFSFICGCCSGNDFGPLKLHECLDVHFREESLRGANQYKCECCGAKGEATKKMSLLRVPEVLIVHLKRFDYGYYWTKKKHDHVEFPVDFTPAVRTPQDDEASPFTPTHGENIEGQPLDMSEWLVKRPTAGADARSPTGAAIPTSCAGTTTYSLSAVVNHHGTFGGGHYTAFTNKGTHGWVLNNDAAISRVSAADVSDSQGYVLVYKKTPLIELPAKQQHLRDLARRYLLKAVPLPQNVGTAREVPNSDDICYMSKLWLHRCATYSEPGLMLNHMCYCNDEKKQLCLGAKEVSEDIIPAQDQARHFHCPCEWFYVPVLRKDFEEFLNEFGGGPLVTHEDFVAQLKKEHTWLSSLLAGGNA